jgi:hypothetical protein
VLSFSNVIAVLALFLALGGSVYAASSHKINGSKIKPKSIPGNRIKAKSLTGNQLKPGSITGTQVKANSLTGKQVVGSTLTGVNAAGLASVNYAVTTMTLGRFVPGGTTGTADCPAGQKVIGGGVTVSDDEVVKVNDSGPQIARGGWEATAFTAVSNMKMTITAICTTVVSIDGQQRQERDARPPIYGSP